LAERLDTNDQVFDANVAAGRFEVRPFSRFRENYQKIKLRARRAYRSLTAPYPLATLWGTIAMKLAHSASFTPEVTPPTDRRGVVSVRVPAGGLLVVGLLGLSLLLLGGLTR
jgi:hypothetical protein